MRQNKMTSGQMNSTMARLSPTLQYDDAKYADIASINLFSSCSVGFAAVGDIATRWLQQLFCSVCFVTKLLV